MLPLLMSFAFFVFPFFFFFFFFLLFLRLLLCLGDNMVLKLLSEWDGTLYALLLKSFMIEAVPPYFWDSCSVAPSVRHIEPQLGGPLRCWSHSLTSLQHLGGGCLCQVRPHKAPAVLCQTMPSESLPRLPLAGTERGRGLQPGGGAGIVGGILGG